MGFHTCRPTTKIGYPISFWDIPFLTCRNQTNITKRGTITEQSNGEKQTIRVGDFKRERRSDRIRGLFRADGVPTGSEDETDDARSHGTKVRIRVKWTERQIDDEKKKTTRRDEILIERRRCSSKHTYRALRS